MVCGPKSHFLPFFITVDENIALREHFSVSQIRRRCGGRWEVGGGSFFSPTASMASLQGGSCGIVVLSFCWIPSQLWSGKLWPWFVGFEEKEQLGGRPIDLDSLASSISGDPASIFPLREGQGWNKPGAATRGGPLCWVPCMCLCHRWWCLCSWRVPCVSCLILETTTTTKTTTTTTTTTTSAMVSCCSRHLLDRPRPWPSCAAGWVEVAILHCVRQWLVCAAG